MSGRGTRKSSRARKPTAAVANYMAAVKSVAAARALTAKQRKTMRNLEKNMSALISAARVNNTKKLTVSRINHTKNTPFMMHKPTFNLNAAKKKLNNAAQASKKANENMNDLAKMMSKSKI